MTQSTRPDTFTFEYASERFQISWNDHAIDQNKIINLGESLDDIYRTYLADYMIMPDPKQRQRVIAYIWDLQRPGVGALASKGGVIDINQTTLYLDNILKPSLWHEMYHLLQFAYQLDESTMQNWMFEGSATLAEIVYASQISRNYKLKSWFESPDVGIPDMDQVGRIPDAYCAVPLFSYLYVQIGGRSKMREFWKRFSSEVNNGNLRSKAWDNVLRSFNLDSWNKFYTRFLASRFTQDWITPTIYYPGLKSETGSSITITPSLSAVTTYTIRSGQPVNQTFSLKANEVKVVRINCNSSSEQSTSYTLTVSDNINWARSFIPHGSDSTVQTPDIYTGSQTFNGHYDPSNRNAVLFTLVGPSKAGSGVSSTYRLQARFS